MKSYSIKSYIEKSHQSYLNEKAQLEQERERQAKEQQKIEDKYYKQMIAEGQEREEEDLREQEQDEFERDALDREQLAIEKEMAELKLQYELQDSYAEAEVDEEEPMKESDQWTLWLEEYREGLKQENDKILRDYWKMQNGGKQKQADTAPLEFELNPAAFRKRSVSQSSFFQGREKKIQAKNRHKDPITSYVQSLKEGKHKKSAFFDRVLSKPEAKSVKVESKQKKTFRI